jgi:phosphohistidine phosphatase
VKTLYILRHAKSSWEKPDIADFERALNEAGLNTAPFMGQLLYDRAFQPDLILSSPAKRAKQTAVLIKETAGFNAEIKYDDRIYEASPQVLLQVIADVKEKRESVMLVGHNPGIEGLIRYLTGHKENMPTAALAIIELWVNTWDGIVADSGVLKELIRPKEEMMKAHKVDED